MQQPSVIPERRIGASDLFILVLPPLLWAGNFVVARGIRGEIGPMTLSWVRWSIAMIVLLPFAWRAMRRDWRLYWQYRWRILAVSLIGVASFNSLVYMGLSSTTATNGVLLNSFAPILIVLFNALLYRQRLRVLQCVGLLLSFTGVLCIILQGHPSNLLSMSLAPGDLLIFVAVVCWSIYSLWLRGIPPEINRIGLTEVQIILAVVALLPFFGWELVAGVRPIWSLGSVAAIAYVGVFPSVFAYLLYNIGVARVGATRAGIFLHLMPVFGAMLSMLFLHEQLHAYHVLGIGAIFVGIGLSSRR